MSETSYRNKLKKYLREQMTFFGAALTFGSTRVTEVMARAGFDFLMVDAQHGNFDKASATDSIRAVAATTCVPFARVAENSAGAINDLLDAGALGIVVPMVNSRADAEAAVRAAFYPPLGARSKGGMAPVFHGEDYPQWANDEILLTVMIETAEALAAVDEILTVPGVDLCLVGTSDLSFEMRCPRSGVEIGQAVASVIAAGRRHGVPVGVALGSPSEVQAYEEHPPAFFLISHDYALLKGASRTLVADMGRALGRPGG
ncbi:HpcH/HpaI aldolase family protein [Telmatospirillum siberiense]|uniref:HpcH/HpaI aldolase/citrate lyase domain-containing protein n=1 Tax=Telmatospirillum siberiense TaxID=382514 RepID=A0A2N3PQN0_9PROT|nr:aldolase/citrate lyase family protein [Telmatospirillum siberiense]PKU22707.1 hypothetical protein CWS72_20485 [Telmatospirillum siberiense]